MVISVKNVLKIAMVLIIIFATGLILLAYKNDFKRYVVVEGQQVCPPPRTVTVFVTPLPTVGVTKAIPTRKPTIKVTE